jgi:acetoin utilization protein AcuB
MIIDQFMTPAPRSIGKDQTLAAAHETMRTHGMRHLPVLDGGRLVGIVSQRDLYFVETLRGVEPESVAVEEAMSTEVYQVHAGALLRDVARTMMEHKYGAAIIVDGLKPIGIFTTTDALAALVALTS